MIETCRLITGGERLLYSVRWSDPSPAANDGNMSASRGLVLLSGSAATAASTAPPSQQSTQPLGSRCFVPGCIGRDPRGGQGKHKVRENATRLTDRLPYNEGSSLFYSLFFYYLQHDYCPHVSACMGLEGPGPYLTTDAQALRVKHSVLNQLPISSDLKHEIWLGARWVIMNNCSVTAFYF